MRRVAKPLVFVLALVPLALLVARTAGVGGLTLGANPVAELIHELGTWGLNFLLLTLAITPLRRLTGSPQWLRFRRMLGLYAFAYLLLHFAAYVVVDQSLDWAILVEDVLERPWITIGFAALLLLAPLAATSTQRAMRRLGRRWQQLHRLVYVATGLGIWHYWWQVKLDVAQPAAYAAVFAVLMGFRVYDARRRRVARERSAAATA